MSSFIILASFATIAVLFGGSYYWSQHRTFKV